MIMTIMMQTQALAQVGASLGENNGCKDNAPRDLLTEFHARHVLRSGKPGVPSFDIAFCFQPYLCPVAST